MATGLPPVQGVESSIADKPDAFLVVLGSKSDPVGEPRLVLLPFQARVETPDTTVTMHYGEREMLTVSPDGQYCLLLSGNIYRPQSADIGSTLLDLYARQGPGFIEGLNGSFALILIDTRAGSILIGTDRINSVKVLTRWYGQTLYVSNSIYLHSVRGLRIDRAAVASYLSVGYLFNERTLFEGIHTLDAASIYQLTHGHLQPHRYWHYRFEPPSQPQRMDELQGELAERLTEATKIRLKPGHSTYVSLSGGYDSSAVLGILAEKLRVPDVHSFSYMHHTVSPGSDEFVAGQIAALYGIAHENIDAFDGSAVQTLRRNGYLGGAMIQPCDEVDAWVQLSRRFVGQPRPVLFTGDTPIVRHDMALKTIADVVYSSGLGDYRALDWTEKILGSEVYREFVDATQADIHRAVTRAGSTRDLYELRDTLYLNQYLSRRIGNWREYFAGRVFSVANPILDNDILDFYRHVPTPMRRAKTLYIRTVTAMFPKLYSIPLATTASYATYWPEAIRQQREELRTLVERQASPLDDVIEPEILLALLASGLRPRSLAQRLGKPAVLKIFH